jgi:H+/Cl- antiporter ClcA
MNFIIKKGITFIFIVVVLFFIGYVCKLYKHTFTKLSRDAKKNIVKNPSALYLLSPLLFWIASRAFLFKNANGPLTQNVKNLFDYLNEPNAFKKIVPFSSLLVMIISSLVTIYSGGSLGSEAIIIHISVFLLLYLVSYFKKYILEINFENLLFLGYIFGVTFAFKSPLASLVLIFEKSLRENSKKLVSNFIFCCIGILIAYTIVDKSKDVFTSSPVSFSYNMSHFLKYSLLAIFCGVSASVLFKLMMFMFNTVRGLVTKSKVLLNVIPIFFGFCLAAMINNFNKGTEITGEGITMVNCEFSKSCLYDFKILLGFLVNVILTYISGCSGGHKWVFMSLGGGIGSVYDSIVNLPSTQTIIIGMNSFFSTIFGNPISSAFIISSITNQNYDTLPMLITMSLISFYSYKYSKKFIDNFKFTKSSLSD